MLGAEYCQDPGTEVSLRCSTESNHLIISIFGAETLNQGFKISK